MPVTDYATWPLNADWATPVNVTLAFKTDMWVSRSGKEQRRALRETPRKRIEFTSVIWKSQQQTMRAVLAKSQNKAMLVPDFTRSVGLVVTTSEGADAELTSVPDWIVAGAYVFFVTPNRVEAREVESIDGLDVTFTDSSAVWPASTKVKPALAGQLATNLQTKQLTDGAVRASIVFDVTPGSEPERDLGTAAATIGGREIFTRRPNWIGGIDVDYQWPIETVDYGRGVTEIFRPINFGTQLFRAGYVNTTSAQAVEIQQAFERAAGRQGEFYMSTWLSDLTMAGAVETGETTFKVAGREVFDAYATDTVHQAIEVVLQGGTRLYRLVDGITLSGDDSIIEIASAWPYDIDPARVIRISWLLACRFASDEMTIEHITDGVSRVQFAIQSLENLPAE